MAPGTAPASSGAPPPPPPASSGASPGAPPPTGKQRAGRLAILACAGLLGLAALSSFLPGGGGRGGGSPSSSYSNRPDGTSAWAELLSRFGRRVDRLRGDLAGAALDPSDTVVVVDAPELSDEEAENLGSFVRRGGHLVAGGDTADAWLRSVVDEHPTWAEKGTRTASPATSAAAPEVDGLRTVRAGRFGSWAKSGSLRPILVGDDDVVIAVAGTSGSGRVVALADTAPVRNGFLAAEDNGALALEIVGDANRRVLFAEGPHGYGESEGLRALPRRWRLALSGLGLAAAIWLFARGRRFGPPEEDARPLPPPRWAYVDAVAGTLVRTNRPQEAVEPVRRRARELIARRAGLPAESGPEVLFEAAVRLGIPPDEAAAALGSPGPSEDATVLAAGRALARLTGGEP
jgi:hypothetical protein